MVISGLRLGLGRAIISLIVGEMYVSVAGLGRLVQQYGNAGRAAELIALAAVIAVFGLLGSGALRLYEERLARWRS